ncbi:hypothetical protein DFJ77DRAFT_514958 [Powellomyces hirtus]|nr:hypothetical protein DFJ77DRAFT_514958 [Powellomyces hirtus]
MTVAAPVRFRDHFWGEDNRGCAMLSAKLAQGIACTKEMVDMMSARATLEEEYAKGMANMLRHHGLNSDSGTMQSVGALVAQHGHQSVTSHSQLAGSIRSELEPPLHALCLSLKALKKRMDSACSKATKTLDKESAAVQKAANVYASRCRDVANLVGAVGGMSATSIQGGSTTNFTTTTKAQERLASAKVEKDKAESELKGAIARHQAAQEALEDQVAEFANLLQEAETARIDLARYCMRTLTDMQVDLSAGEHDRAQGPMSAQIDAIDAVADSNAFVRLCTTGSGKASRLTFQRFVAAEMDEHTTTSSIGVFPKTMARVKSTDSMDSKTSFASGTTNAEPRLSSESLEQGSEGDGFSIRGSPHLTARSVKNAANTFFSAMRLPKKQLRSRSGSNDAMDSTGRKFTQFANDTVPSTVPEVQIAPEPMKDSAPPQPPSSVLDEHDSDRGVNLGTSQPPRSVEPLEMIPRDDRDTPAPPSPSIADSEDPYPTPTEITRELPDISLPDVRSVTRGFLEDIIVSSGAFRPRSKPASPIVVRRRTPKQFDDDIDDSDFNVDPVLTVSPTATRVPNGKLPSPVTSLEVQAASILGSEPDREAFLLPPPRLDTPPARPLPPAPPFKILSAPLDTSPVPITYDATTTPTTTSSSSNGPTSAPPLFSPYMRTASTGSIASAPSLLSPYIHRTTSTGSLGSSSGSLSTSTASVPPRTSSINLSFFSGFLLLHDDIVDTWTKRWCVIDSGFLWIFDSPPQLRSESQKDPRQQQEHQQQQRPRSVVALAGGHVAVAPDAPGVQLAEKDLVFVVVTDVPRRQLLLKADGAAVAR